MKTLYHGTTYLFDEIDPSKGKGYKDFGKGFYATANIKHAERIALRNRRIVMEKSAYNDDNSPITAFVYDLEFDETVLGELKNKIFNNGEDDLEWVRFVNENRASATRTHDFDIVIGPTADDATDIVFNIFRAGGYGDPSSEGAQMRLLELLETWRLPRQYWFNENGARKSLRIVRRKTIR